MRLPWGVIVVGVAVTTLLWESREALYKLADIGSGFDLSVIQPAPANQGVLTLRKRRHDTDQFGWARLFLDSKSGGRRVYASLQPSGSVAGSSRQFPLAAYEGTLEGSGAVDIHPIKDEFYFQWPAGYELQVLQQGSPSRLVRWEISLKDSDSPETRGKAFGRLVLDRGYLVLFLVLVGLTVVKVWREESKSQKTRSAVGVCDGELLIWLIDSVRGADDVETGHMQTFLHAAFVEMGSWRQALAHIALAAFTERLRVSNEAIRALSERVSALEALGVRPKLMAEWKVLVGRCLLH